MTKKPTCRKSEFSLDDVGSWEGYTFGQTWNGFACPYFEFKEAKSIVQKVTDANNYHDHVVTRHKWNFNPRTDTFTLVDPDDEGDHYKIVGEDITFEDKTIHVYGIGNYAWVWTDEREGQELVCEYCNEVIPYGANYIEAKPLYKGGGIGVFCCSDCAGNFFVEKMCVSKVN